MNRWIRSAQIRKLIKTIISDLEDKFNPSRVPTVVDFDMAEAFVKQHPLWDEQAMNFYKNEHGNPEVSCFCPD